MKLRKLILSGFKSFADRTEFDFHDGISCVVGPNGCGKSNIVDAVKWVLGEQSAKSLRGSEMMDVIFNGSSSRRAAGHAEVTLVFDDCGHLLQPNGAEGAPCETVSITRRLFRSGQSEYLINKAPARLRDIREMFMDTGVGTDAYSLIEQGRVEGFLQASQDDRRAIFDEAAGISKYKARKKEALRKLERVDQNLLRINDILGEVEKRLRSIKYQAGKARNYQTYTERLKELRSLHFLAQYHTLKQQRKELQGRLEQLTDQLSSASAKIDQLEATRSGTEVESVDLERAGRELDGRIASVGGQITACEQRGDMLAARVKELGEQIIAVSSRCEETEAKIEQLAAESAARRTELEEADTQAAEFVQRYDAARQEHTAGELAITHLSAKLDDEKAGTIDLLRRTAQLHNEISSHALRRENLNAQRTRLDERADQISAHLSDLLEQRGQFEARLSDVREVLEASQAKLDEIRQAERKLSDSEHEFQKQLSAAREERSAATSRLEALGEMQKRLEGVNAGVRRVLEARQAGTLPMVRGMLGDFVQTDTAHAALVEAAMSGADQQIVADRYDDVQAAADTLRKVLDNSTVEVVCLDRLETFRDDFDLSRCPPAKARVIDWVRFDPTVAPLMWRLLGRTIAVASLAAAAEAARLAPDGYRFVTERGEVLEADGRIRVGAANRSAGVIARRSELVELEARLRELDAKIEELQGRCKTARSEREHLEELQSKLRTAIYEANTERVEAQSRVAQVGEQVERLERERPLIAAEVENLAREIEASVLAEHQAQAKAVEMEALNAERQKQIEALTAQLAGARQRQDELSAQLTEVKVALAQTEQKRLSLRDAAAALDRQREQMEADLSSGRAQIELNRQRRTDAEQNIVRTREEIDRLYAQQEQLQQEARELEETRRGLAEKLQAVRAQLAEQRKAHDALGETVNAARVELGEVDVRVESLIARAADEMNMDLVALLPSYQHDEHRDWDAVEAEIRDLRTKIERLGNVNLDAISEQEELEQRHEFLGKQLADVTASQVQLNELIRRINKESREMFLETFAKIRENFQHLFRKLFGGGKADILLLNEEDVLESPIEIVARPPGKETRTLTLLSGGEKTMTALSLLFSIFQSRPSPFCLLDEVDAALDEANTERFGTLVREFVHASQFIVITHAKRTMSMADVLYGVTMQEPGVSTRISVRFEEVDKALENDLEPAGVS